MHHKLMRASARTAVIGAVVVLGSATAAQGAMAGSAPGGIVSVACNTPALMSAVAGASYGQKLQLSFGCTYRLTAPLPDIDTSLTIVGMGATLERSEAAGTQAFTILTVDEGDVNLIEVNFRDGDGGDGDGGAIDNDGGNITVLGGTFTDNDSAEYGGAIFNNSGTLTVTSAYFTDNGANDYGGAIFNDDTMTLRSTHFSHNGAEYGGAIYNKGIATIVGTTFTEDDSLVGGALYNEDQAALSYVTIQDNYAAGGGGIYNDYGALLTVASSDIVRNFAEGGGGGVLNDDGSVALSLTKVSGNLPDNCDPVGTIAGCSG